MSWVRIVATASWLLFASLSPHWVSGQDGRDRLSSRPEKAAQTPSTVGEFRFESIPDLPDPVGVAGALVGVHRDHLIVAGGANFAGPDSVDLWDRSKQYHRRIHVLRRRGRDGTSPAAVSTSQDAFEWVNWSGNAPQLDQPVAYGASVSTQWGVLCMGGEDKNGPTRRAFLLVWQPGEDRRGTVRQLDAPIPDLPVACTSGAAAVVGDYVYLVAGALLGPDHANTASRQIWRLPLSLVAAAATDQTDVNDQHQLWQTVASWPSEGPERMFPLVTAQHDGFGVKLFVMGGRRIRPGAPRDDLNQLEFLRDAWSLDPGMLDANGNVPRSVDPSKTAWRRLADSPVPLSAGAAVAVGPSHILVPAYADGSVLKEWLASGKPQREFRHPGFPRRIWGYHTIVDAWVPWNDAPANQVTSPAVRWGDDVFLVSGEIRPRVRTPHAWRIRYVPRPHVFGMIDLSVVVLYLVGVLLLGVWFTFRNRSTDDYFRGGGRIPWWAAGCSIFATMLSSITYMAIPAKAFAQDWVYGLGNVMILAVTPLAVWVALPFFRQLDVTSAYEYLERRFNRWTRWLGSASFALFHVFRIGIVLALAGLALSSVIPLTAPQCVAVMGVLAIIYCTLGGITAVVWTDTAQTFVLLGGAIVCLIVAVSGSPPNSLPEAIDAGKFHFVNVDFGLDSFTVMALWVVVLGAFGQNVASYTADQAVVQRYMTTPKTSDAARAIWLNGWMAIPAMLIFFGLGTAFWIYYRHHPEQLDPVMATDRILPLFVSTQLPIGIAGLVVAGIFAAAQSTVSTSMNSGATTIVTDFVSILSPGLDDRRRLRAARSITFLMGCLGTVTGLWFVDPQIRSLFDQFIGVLGLCLGVLAGLFALGVTTRRAHGPGGLWGAIISLLVMAVIALAANGKTAAGAVAREWMDVWHVPLYRVHSYLYAILGFALCFVLGYGISRLIPGTSKPLDGLTWWDRKGPESNPGVGESEDRTT